jgi:hypothetical protein
VVSVTVGTDLVVSVIVGQGLAVFVTGGAPVVSVTVRMTAGPAAARVLADDGGASHMTVAPAAAARPAAPAVAIAPVTKRDVFITTSYIPRVTETNWGVQVSTPPKLTIVSAWDPDPD